jgi:hypothetical protein
MMLAAGWWPLNTRCNGSTVRGAGAIPKLHCSNDPLVTGLATEPLPKVTHDDVVIDEIEVKHPPGVRALKTLLSRHSGFPEGSSIARLLTADQHLEGID